MMLSFRVDFCTSCIYGFIFPAATTLGLRQRDLSQLSKDHTAIFVEPVNNNHHLHLVDKMVVRAILLATLVSICFSYSNSFSILSVQEASAKQISSFSSRTERTEVRNVDTDNTMPSPCFSRRSLLSALITGAAAITTTASSQKIAVAAEDVGAAGDPATNVYFGVGCFWHIMHEFILAEKEILGRNEHQFTSLAGYAGGKSTDNQCRVCYHNMMGVADYGKLGHGEVVGMTLPESKIAEFAAMYFSLFDPRTKDRVDPGDRGSEYRSLIGLPGGTNHPVYPKIEAVATDAGFQLAPGKGNDPDTFGKRLVWVYDSNVFPF